MAGGQTQQQQRMGAQSSYGQGSSTQNMVHGQPPYGQGMGRQSVRAGFWWRVLAFILDNVLLLLPLSLLQNMVAGQATDVLSFWMVDSLMASSQGAEPPPLPDGVMGPLLLASLVSVVVHIVYRTILVTMQGATVGQLITGLRVVPDGAPVTTKPDWGVSAIRATAAVVFWQIPILNLVDALVMLGSDKKQTLHDRIARTIVIKK